MRVGVVHIVEVAWVGLGLVMAWACLPFGRHTRVQTARNIFIVLTYAF